MLQETAVARERIQGRLGALYHEKEILLLRLAEDLDVSDQSLFENFHTSQLVQCLQVNVPLKVTLLKILVVSLEAA